MVKGRHLAAVAALFVVMGVAGCLSEDRSYDTGDTIPGDTLVTGEDAPFVPMDAVADDAAPEVAPSDTVDTIDAPDDEPLTVAAIAPKKGTTGGGDQIIIEGTGFREGTAVLFGQSSSPTVFVLNAHRINVITPPGLPGLVDVTVTSPSGESVTIDKGFLYFNEVAITSVEPAEGSVVGGEPLTIRGTGFVEGSNVVVGSRLALQVEVVDDDTILALSPEGDEGPADVYVSNDKGVAELDDGYLYRQPPFVTHLAPSMGPVSGGVAVLLEGGGFSPEATVYFGDAEVTETTWLGWDAVMVGAPVYAAGYVDVAVVTDWGTALVEDGFYYYPDSLVVTEPQLVTVQPSEGPLGGGTSVWLGALGLTTPGDTTVLVGSKLATITSFDGEAGLVELVLPPGAEPGVVDVTLANSDGSSTLAEAFTYLDTPTITAIAPVHGPMVGGLEVTITGTGLAQVSHVAFGPLPASDITALSDTMLTAVTPPGSPGYADVTVLAPSGEGLLEDGFLYDGPYELILIAPDSGSRAGGTQVTVIGSGFSEDATLTIGGVPVSHLHREGPTMLTGKTPPGAVGTVDVQVQSTKGVLTLESAYTYFDPMSSYGGTWGGAIDDQVNVTVLDGGTGAPLADVFVMIGTDPDTPHQGFTNLSGQVTFSGPGLGGPIMLSASKECYASESVVDYDAANVTMFMSYNCPSSGGMPPGVSPGLISGNVIGFDKYVVVPQSSCTAYTGSTPYQCEPCATDADCGGAVCTPLDDGAFCLMPCSDDFPCDSGFLCTGFGADDARCIPTIGTRMTVCHATKSSPFGQAVPPGDGALVDEEGHYLITTRLGQLAVVCFAGVEDWVTGAFTPMAMGAVRHLDPIPGVELPDNDVALTVPLSGALTVRLDDPPVVEDDPYFFLSAIFMYIDLGSDGVLDISEFYDGMPAAYAWDTDEPLTIDTLPAAFVDDIYDCSYTILAGAFAANGESTPQSLTLHQDITGVEDDQVYLVDSGVVEAVPTGMTKNIRGIWGTSASDVFLVGAGGAIIHYNGFDWGAQSSPTEADLTDVWGFAEDDVWAVGSDGTILHFDGVSWKEDPTVPTANDLTGIWGATPDDLWAVGWYTILHYDGVAWATVPGIYYNLTAIHGLGPSDVWAVGRYGDVVHYDGSSWSWMESTTSKHLLGVWGSSKGDVWAVGEGGSAVHFDGIEWSTVGTGTVANLRDVWGSSWDDVHVVGDGGLVLHYNGAAFVDISGEGLGQNLSTVWGPPEGPLVTTGQHEIVLGPILEVPENLTPPDGGVMTDLYVGFEVEPGKDAHFNIMSIAVPGLFGDTPVWNMVTEGKTMGFSLPSFSLIEGTPDVPSGSYKLTILRVYREGFDIDNYDLLDFDTMRWTSWAIDVGYFAK